ncbi:hypothetical protein GSI_08665 [Ganoderma sinense ZZ0214-1]|uniref:BTB domain-containing protein n=1 Tax=Ganoderma sinense ZZ0214-1 TaxID=1077348 RepID=A0A2G8S4B7_9APHY|nr:hypothetical protein GSI_08665 [Ganoderma sinense ZZ0214-1]
MNPDSVLERHPDLYFIDGDVVLAVKQTSHHSSVFANFFSDANAAPAEAYGGTVPLAEMHGDKAEDFALLLSYLYNPSSLVFRRNDPNTPLIVAGVVRLADKYLIEPLHRRLVQQVCDDWPTRLTEYDIRQGEVDALRKVAMSNYPIRYSPDDDRQRLSDVIPEPASAIMFAYEFGCPQILPAAFYRLSLIPVTHDWSSTRVDTLLTRWSLLDGKNLLRCMRGCQSFRLYRPQVTQFMCEDCARLPRDASPCYRYVERLFDGVFTEKASSTHRDPLHLLDKCRKYDDGMPELSLERCPDRPCDDCWETVHTGLVEERRRIWRELPESFNLA